MRPIQIFFSYAREDEQLMDEVRRQLILFDRQRLIEKWYDRKILPGQEYARQIDKRLRLAQIILLFISPYFMESDYCFDVEMEEALRRHDAGEAVVIPVILRPCRWQTAPFGCLNALPTDGHALTLWQNRDEASLDVADGIMRVVSEISSSPV